MPLHLLDPATAALREQRRAGHARQSRRASGTQTRPLGGRDGAALHFWRPLPRTVIDLVCGEGRTPALPLHAHEGLHVLLPATTFAVADGAGRVSVVSPGTIHLTSPLGLLGAQSIDGAPLGLRVLLAGPQLVRELIGDAGVPGATRVVEDPDEYAALCALLDDLRQPLVALELAQRLRACLARLFAHLLARREAPAGVTRSAAGAERTREYLGAHVAEPASLDDLAAVAGLSKFHLLRAFRHAYGLTPHHYQMRLRLARARRLIAEGYPLSRVAYEAGFADQSHLTRRFAELYGLTPARFGRQLAAPAAPARHGTTALDRGATRQPAA